MSMMMIGGATVAVVQSDKGGMNCEAFSSSLDAVCRMIDCGSLGGGLYYGCDEHKAALRTVQSQISVTLAQIALQERRNERIEGEPREPPCVQCGAMTEEEAGQKCLGQAVDDCHGNRLWLDD